MNANKLIVILFLNLICIFVGGTPLRGEAPQSDVSLVEVVYGWHEPKNGVNDIVYQRLIKVLGKQDGLYYYIMYARCNDEILIARESDMPMQDWSPERVVVNGKDTDSIDYTEFIGKSRIILYQQTPYGLLQLGELNAEVSPPERGQKEFVKSVRFVNTITSAIGKESPPTLWHVAGAIGGAVSIADYTRRTKEDKNHAPAALFSVIPEIGTSSTTFAFDAGISSDADEPTLNLLVRWDWDNDGVWDTGFSTTKTVARTFAVGTHTVNMQIRDSNGAYANVIKSITVIPPGGPLASTTHPMFRNNLQHTGLSALAGPTTDTVKWQYPTGAVVESSPAIASDNTVYIGSYDGKVYALNPNGTLNWSSPALNGVVHSSPAIATDGTVYIGAGNYVYALTGTTGAVKWFYDTGALVRSSPAIGPDGTVYIGSGNGNIYAVNYDGSLKWAYPTGGWIDSAPAIAPDGTLYIGSNDRYLYALNTNPLSLNWRYLTGGSIAAAPTIGADGTIYTGASDGVVYALNPDGTLKWTRPTGGAIYSSPAVNAAALYIGSDDFSLYSLALSTGAINWTYPTTATVRSSPTIDSAGRVYFGSDDGRVYCLDSAGILVWSVNTGSAVRSSPAINVVGAAPPVIYIGSDNNNIYAIGAAPIDPADVVLRKQANKKYVTIGDIITYTISISNQTVTTDTSNSNIVVDIIPAGFKYIPGSSRVVSLPERGLGNSPLSDPVITVGEHPPSAGRSVLTFADVGAINPSEARILSYQLAVGSGVSTGRYTNSAYCNYFDIAWKTSNTAVEEVLVVDDPIFDLGTIIGRAFIDDNANGAFDEGENGIPAASIIMEDGTVVITDREGRYHVAGVRPGAHLLKLLYYFKLNPVGGNAPNQEPYSQLVYITGGLLAKANFAVNPKDSKPQAYSPGGMPGAMLYSGQMNYSSAKGDKDLANKGRTFPRSGRLTTLGRRLFKDERFAISMGSHLPVPMMLSYDSARRLTSKEPEIFRYIDPDKYYPDYGDSSNIYYDAANTQGPLYLCLGQLPAGRLLIGNYQTNINQPELINYNRSLYGTILQVNAGKGLTDTNPRPRSGRLTTAGELTSVTFFTSQARQLPALSQFRATGGSFYYLKHQNIVASSENITIEVRDKITNLTLESAGKTRGQDYEIDYTNGRIIFSQPVGMVSSSTSIISTNTLNGNPVYINVNYEYQPDALDVENSTYGGRISANVPVRGGSPRLGATYINQSDSVENYQLGGVDVNLRFHPVTITAEYAQSVSSGIPGYLSLDGGSAFSPLVPDPTAQPDGNAYLLKAQADVAKNIQTRLTYQRVSDGFTSTSALTQQGTQKYGVTTDITASRQVGISFGYDVQELINKPLIWLIPVRGGSPPGTLTDWQIGAQRTDTAFLKSVWTITPDKLTLAGEYRYQAVTSPSTIATETNSGTDLLAARLDYQYSTQTRLFVAQQVATQSVPSNNYIGNQTTIGGATTFSDKSTLSLQGTVASSNEYGILGGFSYPVNQKTSVYSNYNMGVSDIEGRTSTSAVGSRSQVTDATAIHAQQEFKVSDTAVQNNQVLGQDTRLTTGWSIGNTIERGIINYTDGAQADRQTISLNAQYRSNNRNSPVPPKRDREGTDKSAPMLTSGASSRFGGTGHRDENPHLGLTTLSTKLELRTDDGITNKKQYVTANNLRYQITEDLSGLLRLNWAKTQNTSANITEGLFREYGIGAALRPVKRDRWHLIGKYSYLEDVRQPVVLVGDPRTSLTGRTAQVYSVETAYDIALPLQIVEKYARREMVEAIGLEPEVKSRTGLWVNRFNYTIKQNWLASAEYRVRRTAAKSALSGTSGVDDIKSGYLVEGGYRISPFVQFGVGYNFTDFSDSLERLNDYSVRGIFIRLNVIF